MGNGILTFYREHIRKSWKTAFWSAFFMGLLVHIYKFTNILPNSDALYNFYSSNNMVASGRWFLAAACSLSSFFDLPWINGLLSLVFMGLTAAAVAEVFRMENPVLILLSSGLQVSFPAITATMSYEFTADGYMLAMALAALSVCLSRMEYIGWKRWPRLVLSGVCLCLSCAIYQAYVSYAFVLAVTYFITELLENRRQEKEYWNWIGGQILIYGGALAAYYVIWKACLAIQGIPPTTYQGMDQIGFVGMDQVLPLLKWIVGYSLHFLLEWELLVLHGPTVYSGLNILFLIAFAAVLLAAVRRSGMLKHRLHLLMLLLSLAALPLGIYIWQFVSSSVGYHTLMLQSVCLLYILTAVLFERWARPRAADLALVLLGAIVFNNSVTANVYYNHMQQCYEKTYSAAVEISTRIHLLDDGTVRKVAVYGALNDWGEDAKANNEELRQLGALKRVNRTMMSPIFLMQYTDFNLSYYRENDPQFEYRVHNSNDPSPNGVTYPFAVVSQEEMDALVQTPQFQAMPIWPARDSVQVFGDTVVVKLGATAVSES